MSAEVMEPRTPPALRRRTRIGAALLSLIMPGLGHAFLGRYRRGAFFAMAIIAALLVLKFSVFLWPAWRPAVLPIILLAFIAGVAIVLWALIDSWRVGRRAAVPRPAWPKRYFCYLAFIFAWFLPNALGPVAPVWRGFGASSASMLPNLQPGDYFFVLAGYFDTHEPQRGDLVVFKLPCQYPRLDRATAAALAAHCDKTTADSRDPGSGVGFVPRDRLVGKAAFIYFSLDRRSSRAFFPAIHWDRIGMALS